MSSRDLTHNVCSGFHCQHINPVSLCAASCFGFVLSIVCKIQTCKHVSEKYLNNPGTSLKIFTLLLFAVTLSFHGPLMVYLLSLRTAFVCSKVAQIQNAGQTHRTKTLAYHHISNTLYFAKVYIVFKKCDLIMVPKCFCSGQGKTREGQLTPTVLSK